MSPKSYLLCKAKQMFPNAQLRAACKEVICCASEERHDWVSACASVLRRGEGAMGNVLLMLRSLFQPLHCLSASKPTRRAQMHWRKKGKKETPSKDPKQGGIKQSKGAFPG